MSDENVAEIYAFARDAFKGGAQEFQVQAFPFRMTQENMARYADDPNYPFWQMLKTGYDIFEITRRPPQIDVCEKRYVFNQARADGKPLDPQAACPVEHNSVSLAASFGKDKQQHRSIFGNLLSNNKKAPSASIKGLEEAQLVADWSKRRARGEKVTAEPPSL